MSPSSTSRRRAKSRKQRFLSLSRELAAAPRTQKQPGPAVGAMKRRSATKPRPRPRRRDRDTATRDAAAASCARAVAVPDGSKPLDLFPMHPEPHALDEDDPRHAAALFDDPDYYATTATLTSLLGPDQDPAAADQPHVDDTAFSVTAVPQHAHSPASSTPRDLARSVLRGRERWVLCQQLDGEDGEEEGEASSCGVSAAAAPVDHHRGSWCIGGVPQRRSSTQLCFLKLDYDEVLSAWSGAGSVYVEGEAAQVVPDDNHHHQEHYLAEQPAIFVEVGGIGGGCGGTTGSDSSGSNLWVVPEGTSVGGTREARVLRYKEKRQNRLFAKRIRYEVRKLNAQKRPRIKGRFVKRTQEQP